MIDDARPTACRDPQGLEAIAGVHGEADAALRRKTETLLRRVEKHYAGVRTAAAGRSGNLVFTGDDPTRHGATLRRWVHRPETVIRQSAPGIVPLRATRSARARETLTELIPRLLQAFADTSEPDAFLRFDRLLAGLRRPSAFACSPIIRR